MSKFSSLLQVLSSPKRLKSILSFNHKGYLNDIGWFKAFESHSPVDGEGDPIPWVTYSFIDFIKERLRKQHTVFEFGSGNSTFFYAKYAGLVVSVEHDKDWFEKIVKSKPENSEMIFLRIGKRRKADYCHMPVKLEENLILL